MSIHLLILLLMVVAPGVVIATLLVRVVARPRPDAGAAEPDTTADPRAGSRARVHAGTGAALAGVLGAVALIFAAHGADALVGTWAGVAYGLAPAAAGLTFVAVLAVTEVTWPAPTGARRTASLVRRQVRDVAPHRLRVWTWTTVLLALVVTVSAGVTAAPDGTSFDWYAPGGELSTSGSPYPGWTYGLPLLGACLLLLAGSEACLRLVVARPQVPLVGVRVDRALRRLSAHRLLRGTQLATACTVAGMLLVAGARLNNTALNASLNGDDAGALGPLGTLATVAGAVLALVAVVIACWPAPRPDAMPPAPSHAPGTEPAGLRPAPADGGGHDVRR